MKWQQTERRGRDSRRKGTRRELLRIICGDGIAKADESRRCREDKTSSHLDSADSEKMDILETDAFDRRQRRNMVCENNLLISGQQLFNIQTLSPCGKDEIHNKSNSSCYWFPRFYLPPHLPSISPVLSSFLSCPSFCPQLCSSTCGHLTHLHPSCLQVSNQHRSSYWLQQCWAGMAVRVSSVWWEDWYSLLLVTAA